MRTIREHPGATGNQQPIGNHVLTMVLFVFTTVSSAENPRTPRPETEARPALTAARKDKPFVNSLGMKFVPVQITNGSAGGRRVLFSVWDTRVQDYAVYAAEVERAVKKPHFEQDPTHPVVNVSWEDAKAFCEWLTEKERRSGKLGAGERYRLPRDHEWSCAVEIGAREDATALPPDKDGKIKDEYPWGKMWPPPKGAGNYRGEEFEILDASTPRIEGFNDGMNHTSPVGSFRANGHGLYDMGGNVWQWCEDLYDSHWSARVVRGASYYNYEKKTLESSFRFNSAPAERYSNIGFRCVLASRD